MPSCLQKQPHATEHLLFRRREWGGGGCALVNSPSPHLLLTSSELGRHRSLPPHAQCTHRASVQNYAADITLIFLLRNLRGPCIPKLKIVLPKDEHRCLWSPQQYPTEESTHLEKIPWTLIRSKSVITLISLNQHRVKKSAHSIPPLPRPQEKANY